MEIREEVQDLNPWIYCWFVTTAIIWLLSFIWMWQFSLSCLLFAIPFCVFLRWWNKNRMHCSLDHAMQAFIHGFINIPILTMIAAFIGLFVLTMLFYVTHLFTFSLTSFLYIIMSITYYVSIEEALKLYFALKQRKNIPDPVTQVTKKDTITATATSLGYSTITGIFWTVFVAISLDRDDIHDDDHYTLFGWLFLVTVIIAVIGMPMHLITGYLMGCKMMQKDIQSHENNEEFQGSSFKRYVNVIYFPIFIRSTYIFFLVIGFLVMHFSFFGLIIAVIGIVVDYVLLIKCAKKVEKSLPSDYLQRAGRLSIFGYNVLNDYEDDHEDNIDAAAFDNIVNDNDVQITTHAFDSFAPSADLDEPMVVGSNPNNNAKKENKEKDIVKTPEMQYKKCALNDKDDDDAKVEVHVSSEILDEDEADSSHQSTPVR